MLQRMKRLSQSINMTKGSPYKLLIMFSIPLLIGNAFQQLYNTVDSIVVGQFVGGTALAAVGAGFPIMFALLALFMGLGMGGTVLISQFYGADDYDGMNRTIGTVYRIVLIGSIPMAVIGFFVARPLLIMLNVPDDGTLTQAVYYLQIILIGMTGSIGFNINSGILQGLGDGVSSLLFLAITTVTNIILDLLFVIVFGWGVPGVALATIIAQWFSWILGVIYINRKYDFIKISRKEAKFDPKIAREVVRIGVPSSIQQVMFSVGAMVLNSLINSYGSSYMAGYNAGHRLDTFVFLPIQSASIAITTFVGQNIGAKRLDRVRQGLKAGLLISGGIAVVTALILYPLSPFAMRLFTQDQVIIDSGVEYLHAVLPFYFLLAGLFIYNGTLRGAGQTLIPMISSFFSLWLVRVPAAYLLAENFGRGTLFYSFPIGWIMGIAISGLYYHFGPWKERVLRELEEVKEEPSGIAAVPGISEPE